MHATKSARAAAVVILSCSLLGVSAVGPASATPQAEAQLLSAFKQTWPKTSRSTQATLCMGYKVSPSLIINSLVSQTAKNATISAAVTKPGIKRVVTKYLAWACSGPGTTPRR